MAMRTKKGNVTAAARKKATGSSKGKFPVFDHKSAISAINLRHNGKGVSPAAVLSKVARWASTHGDKAVLEKVRKARLKDRNGVK